MIEISIEDEGIGIKKKVKYYLYELENKNIRQI